MNITIEELAEKIVTNIMSDLNALSTLGDFNSMLKSTYGKNVMESWKLTIAQLINDAIKDRSYIAFFDGSAKPNPGLITIGGYIKDPYMKVVYSYSTDLDGVGTNNEAEYKSLLHRLDILIDKGITVVKIFGDSNLVVQQVNGAWQAKNQRMKDLRDQALKKLNQIETWSLSHVPREQNKEADNLTR